MFETMFGKPYKEMKWIVNIIVLAIIAIVGGTVLSSLFYRVDAGETVVVTRYGQIIDIKTSGLNFKTPIDDIVRFNTREAKEEFGKYTDNGDVYMGLAAYTADRQTATVALTLTYQISNPEEVYKRYKTTENMINTLVAPRVRQQLEITFSKYTSATVIEKRGEFAQALRQSISESFKDYPIVINDVQSVFNFSREYEKMIEESVNKDVTVRNQERQTRIAQEQAKEAQIRAEAEAKIKLTQAEAAAKERTLQADAEAHAIKVKGEAEAASVKALAEALEKNKDLVALETARKWDGKLPTYIPNGTVMPFIQLPQQAPVNPAK